MRGQDVRKMSKATFNTWDQHGRKRELTPQVVLWPAHAHCGTVGVGYMCACTYTHQREEEQKNKTDCSITWVAEVNSGQMTIFTFSHTADRLAPVQYLHLRNHYKPGFHELKGS